MTHPHDRLAPEIALQPSASKPKLGSLGLLLLQANFGWMLALSVSGTLIPALMEQVDPSAKVALYGTVTSIGAFTAIVANIVFGSLSDRTRTRWGRRNPWILGGGLFATAALSAIAFTESFPLIVVLYALFQIGLNALLAPLAAVLPDRVPPARRGTASALIGAGTLIAQSLGAVVGAAFLADLTAGLLLVPLVMALTCIVFVVFARDRTNRDVPRPTSTVRELLSSFRVPTDRDFLLALFGRLSLLLAFYCVVLFQYFVLQDYLDLDQAGVARTLAWSGVIMAVSAGLGTVISGPLSDWLRRRKILVVAASLVIAVAFVPLIITPSSATFLLFMGIAGFAYGIYIAVDQALMSEILPDDAAHGKDMGILNIANRAPQIIAPGLAAIALGAGIGYGGLFIIAIAFCLLSAVLIGLIRRGH